MVLSVAGDGSPREMLVALFDVVSIDHPVNSAFEFFLKHLWIAAYCDPGSLRRCIWLPFGCRQALAKATLPGRPLPSHGAEVTVVDDVSGPALAPV